MIKYLLFLWIEVYFTVQYTVNWDAQFFALSLPFNILELMHPRMHQMLFSITQVELVWGSNFGRMVISLTWHPAFYNPRPSQHEQRLSFIELHHASPENISASNSPGAMTSVNFSVTWCYWPGLLLFLAFVKLGNGDGCAHGGEGAKETSDARGVSWNGVDASHDDRPYCTFWWSGQLAKIASFTLE